YIHGGYKASDVVDYRGFKVHDIAKQKPTVGRAVLIDVPRYKNVEVLPDSYKITVEDIKETLEMEKVDIEKGDVAIIRTGFMKAYWSKDSKRFTDRSAGISLEAAKYLIEEKGVSVIGGDNVSVEAIPAHELEVHAYSLVEKGVPLMENMNLEELHERKVYEFIIAVAPLRIVGATASMVNPLAFL
ncbi:MAG TPA: cyclase family protein, partial [Bacillota bacterium]|nr:cyclase family protein [Bacillota bacterium]